MKWLLLELLVLFPEVSPKLSSVALFVIEAVMVEKQQSKISSALLNLPLRLADATHLNLVSGVECGAIF